MFRADAALGDHHFHGQAWWVAHHLRVDTSGTPGHPKCSTSTHGRRPQCVESCRQVLALADLGRFVLILRPSHSFTLTACIVPPLLVGGSLVLFLSLHAQKHALQQVLQ